jgi:sporulation protein YlmC with PRC-barrel domain
VVFLISVDELSGKNVIGADGIVLGDVKGTEVNTSTWQMTNLRVKLSSQASGNLGFKKRLGSSTVCVPVSLITAVGDVVVVGKTLDELSTNPEVTECPT